ncbi:hypothetical protein [Desulfogranum mediterraneum]|uniref:hypothetical protein n=1 Tax=Desulfogranum mediterraneum TaxID=160661 RepID=UPI0004250F9C|nr:hypothetical protein [Desulfogranum mediterraneum]
MQKTLTALILGLALTLGTGMALAKSSSCVVVEVEGDRVTLECSKLKDLVPGTKVKVKTAAKKAIEGC